MELLLNDKNYDNIEISGDFDYQPNYQTGEFVLIINSLESVNYIDEKADDFVEMLKQGTLESIKFDDKLLYPTWNKRSHNDNQTVTTDPLTIEVKNIYPKVEEPNDANEFSMKDLL